jgi:hypothetical protein
MIKKLLVCLFCISVIGCAQKPLVNINAMSAGKSVGKNYVIIPARQELWDTKQLEYTQIVREVAASLSVMGYRLVDKPENADQAILLDFNRSGAVSSTRNVTVPIYGQTGVSSSTTYGTANTTYLIKQHKTTLKRSLMRPFFIGVTHGRYNPQYCNFDA